jgi:hypothetical protein
MMSVTISNGVTSIGDEAFYNCACLTSVDIPESITSIGDAAFSDCYMLATATIDSKTLSIGSQAFRNCNNLTHIYFVGTDEEWNGLAKGDGWAEGMNYELHCNYDSCAE